MSKQQNTKELSPKEFEAIGRDFWQLYELNYSNRRRMFFFTFGKGVAQGFGIFLGGTILVALLLYGLSFFDEIPFVQNIYNALTDPTSVKSSQQ